MEGHGEKCPHLKETAPTSSLSETEVCLHLVARHVEIMGEESEGSYEGEMWGTRPRGRQRTRWKGLVTKELSLLEAAAETQDSDG